MTDEQDTVDDLERVTVYLLPEASAALIQGAAGLGMSRTDFINLALVKTADLVQGVTLRRTVRWFPWVTVCRRIRIVIGK